MTPLNMLLRSDSTVKVTRLYFELSNLDDVCTEGESKIQSCNVTSHGLTAYKGAPYEESFRIEHRTYIGRRPVVIFFC